ncbi:MAG: hypothetical protein M3177_06120 [Pseudomonadota bacterium]|nr:hypothetical protein [Pseudomonadota bacterium]
MNQNEIAHRTYRRVGLIATMIYLTLIIVWSIYSRTAFAGLRPNEWGDFLAGSFGPLALFWLILGFWQQGDELRSSVEALRLQGQELANSVEQQRALVEVTRQQVEAELAARQDEREARRIAQMPLLTLHNAGGYRAGQDRIWRMKITNIGANCSDITLQFTKGLDQRHFFSALHTGASESLEFNFSRSNAPNELEVLVSYRTLAGTLEIKRYLLTSQSILDEGRYTITELVQPDPVVAE